MSQLLNELFKAQNAANEAARFIMKEYESFTAIPNAPASISTHVDHGAQEIILKYLHQAFPDDQLMAEEPTETLAKSPKGSDRCWVVDPIDGTRGFAMKNNEFCTMIGLMYKNQPVFGLVHEPTLGRTTYAMKGSGCWVSMNAGSPIRCQVTNSTFLDVTTLVISHRKEGAEPKPAELALQPLNVIQTYSAGIKLALVARGEADIYLNDYPKFHDWDICAGQIMVEEAGGRVTEWNGNRIEYGLENPVRHGGMIATNGNVHDQALAALATL